MKNDTAKQLDQYYTNKNYAKHFYNVIQQSVDLNTVDTILEPSAGTGSFFNLFDKDKRIGVDLDPKCEGIIEHDFLTWNPCASMGKIITVGNPPFGKNACSAVNFFNHAATFSDTIAFILPKTFRKSSIINRLDVFFHLTLDVDVPPNSFVFNDKTYDVWCCAQIWQRQNFIRTKRKILPLSTVSSYFEITTPEDADFAIQRVGSNAGLIREVDFLKYSKQSHYFFKQHHPLVLDIFKTIDFSTVKFNTAGNPSVSASEIVFLWIESAKTYNINAS